MLQHVSVLYFFSGLNTILLYEYITICLSILELMGIWVISTLLAIMNTIFEHLYAVFCMGMCFYFSWLYIPTGSYGNSIFNLSRNGQAVFHSGCTISHSHQQCEGYSFSTSSPTLVNVSFFDSSHSGGCEVISHCGFLFFFFKFLFIYLFIFGCVGSLLLRAGFLQLRRVGAALHCGARASHCGGFPCCGARALGARASVVVACGLQSTGSVVVAHWLSCSAACGVFPDQGSNPCPCTDRQILNHCTTREVLIVLFIAFTQWLMMLSIFSCAYCFALLSPLILTLFIN